MKIASYLAAAACAGLLYGGQCAFADAPAAPTGTAATAAAPLAPGATLLRLKFKVGDVQTYDLLLHIAGTIGQGGAGAGMPLDQTMDMSVTQTVQSIDPTTGYATVKSSVSSKKVTILMNGKDVSPPATQQPQPITNVTSVLEPNGKVDSFNMDKAVGGNMPMGMDSNSPMLGAFFGPDKPVAVGDTWSRTTTGGLMGMTYNTTYKLADLSVRNGNQIATVGSKQTGSMSTKMGGGATMLNGTFDTDQSTLFDNTLGLMQSLTSTSHMHMVIATDTSQPPPAGGAAPNPVNEKIDLTQTMTMTLEGAK